MLRTKEARGNFVIGSILTGIMLVLTYIAPFVVFSVLFCIGIICAIGVWIDSGDDV